MVIHPICLERAIATASVLHHSVRAPPTGTHWEMSVLRSTFFSDPISWEQPYFSLSLLSNPQSWLPTSGSPRFSSPPFLALLPPNSITAQIFGRVFYGLEEHGAACHCSLALWERVRTCENKIVFFKNSTRPPMTRHAFNNNSPARTPELLAVWVLVCVNVRVFVVNVCVCVVRSMCLRC